jgi:hypothetical protein
MAEAVLARQRSCRRIACLIGTLALLAAAAASAPPTAMATHVPGHVCATIDFAGERCFVDPTQPGSVGDDVCIDAQDFGRDCYIAKVQDTCVNLVVRSSCVYREVRPVAGEPEVPGKPSTSPQSLNALLGSADCVVTESVLQQREAGGLCARHDGGRHHFYDCTLPEDSWCIYNVRHSYHYGTAAFDRQGSNADVFVCVKFIRDSNGNMISRACAYQYVELSVGADGLKKPGVYNGNQYRRTIAGYARF